MEVATMKSPQNGGSWSESTPNCLIVNFGNNYIELNHETQRALSVNLQTLSLSGKVSAEDMATVSKYITMEHKDEQEPLSDATYLKEFKSLIHFLRATETTDNLGTALVAIKKLLKEHPPDFATIQALEDASPEESVFTILSRLLRDGVVDLNRTMAFSVLVVLLVEYKSIATNCDCEALMTWIRNALDVDSPDHLDFIVQHAQNLLSVQPLRKCFYETPGIMERIKNILEQNSGSAQMQYQIIYCLWLLTFEKSIAETILSSYSIAGTIISIAKATLKEKIVRITVLVFVNLFNLAFEVNIAHAIGNKLSGLVDSLSSRQWADPSIESNLKFLRDELDKGTAFLSTWDEYLCEVTSGKLDYSPSHFSEHFWKDNAQRLDDNDYELLIKLIDIMKTSEVPECIAIAVSDLGNYAKYNTPGIM